MTDRKTIDQITSDQLDDLYEQLDLLDATATALKEELAALRTVARGYCPACGRGDAAPSVADWEQQKQRADQAEAERDQLRHLRAVAGIHFRAIGHHLNDADIRLPDPVFRLCRLLDDELTATLEALAEQHPTTLAAPGPAATELQEQQ